MEISGTRISQLFECKNANETRERPCLARLLESLKALLGLKSSFWECLGKIGQELLDFESSFRRSTTLDASLERASTKHAK